MKSGKHLGETRVNSDKSEHDLISYVHQNDRQSSTDLRHRWSVAMCQPKTNAVRAKEDAKRTDVRFFRKRLAVVTSNQKKSQRGNHLPVPSVRNTEKSQMDCMSIPKMTRLVQSVSITVTDGDLLAFLVSQITVIKSQRESMLLEKFWKRLYSRNGMVEKSSLCGR